MVNGLYILDGSGAPFQVTDFPLWAHWREEHHDALTIGRTVLTHPTDGRIVVLTVFTGRDHRFSERDTEPVLWETLVFGGPPTSQGERDRYRSQADAIAGHQAICEHIIERCAADRAAAPVRRHQPRSDS